MKRRESVGGNKRKEKETKEEWKDGLMEGRRDQIKREVRNDGMHNGRQGRSKRGRKECRGKEE